MLNLNLPNLPELAPKTPVKLDQARRPSYGRSLEDFTAGEVYVHPRGLTITPAFAIEFAATFHEANPLYLNREFARAHGFKDILVSPLLVMNIALSLGVQNDSEKAMANLGYYNVKFTAPVYPKDTLRAYTKILEVKNRGEGKPGIVTFRTSGVNQDNNVVIQYERKIMVNPAGKKTPATTLVQKTAPEAGDTPALDLPEIREWPRELTGVNTYFGAFRQGDIIVHANGRTVTDEHYAWTYRCMNTHPLHYDKLYSAGLEGKMSGEPIVYGGLALAWLCGLASRDVSENALWDLGYTEGYHTQPVVSGDTLAAISRILKTEPLNDKLGRVSLQLIGVKNIRAGDALDKYGAELFIKENGKKELGKEKIAEKVFEIERRLLVKK